MRRFVTLLVIATLLIPATAEARRRRRRSHHSTHHSHRTVSRGGPAPDLGIYVSAGAEGVRPLADINPFQAGVTLATGLRLGPVEEGQLLLGLRGYLRQGETTGLVHAGERTWAVELETGVRPAGPGWIVVFGVGMGQGTAWVPGLERTSLLMPVRMTIGWSVPVAPQLALDGTLTAGACLVVGDVFGRPTDLPFRALVSAGLGVTWVP